MVIITSINRTLILCLRPNLNRETGRKRLEVSFKSRKVKEVKGKKVLY